jgi:hypothetical protein
MRALRWACRTAAAIVLPWAVLSCRPTDGPTGTGRIAPSLGALSVQPVLGWSPEEPVVPLREARIRLFRIPGVSPEVAVIDTLVPFLETDDDREVTLAVALTMANERFLMELALLDDQRNVVFLGRDTVIAYTSGQPPPARPLRLRYTGPDTAVARIAVAPNDTILAIGDELTLRVAAFLPDGRATSVRVGFAVHGSPAITVDVSGVVRARVPEAVGAAWVVARTLNGLVDSVSVGAVVPARAITLSPGSGRITVGRTIALAAVMLDSAGAPIDGREPAWRSSDERVATVKAGTVTGVGVGTAEITATSERASGTAVITVLPGGVARVVPSVTRLRLEAGEEASVSAAAFDALGEEIIGESVRWSIGDAGIARVPDAAAGSAKVTVVGVAAGTTTLEATIDGVSAAIEVEVRRPHEGHDQVGTIVDDLSATVPVDARP